MLQRFRVGMRGVEEHSTRASIDQCGLCLAGDRIEVLVLARSRDDMLDQ